MLSGLLDQNDSSKEKLENNPSKSSETTQKALLDFETLIKLYINPELIGFDPHFHTSFSDGEAPKDILETLKLMSKDGANADHSRKNLNAVILYNSPNNSIDNPYCLDIWKGIPDTLEGNMDILESTVEIEEKEEENIETNKESLESFYANEIENILAGGPVPQISHAARSLAAETVVESEPMSEEIEKELAWEAEKSKGGNVNISIERDYESWLDNGIEDFLEQNRLKHAVISVHNLPEGYIRDNMHEKQTQYLRKADLSHLPDSELESAVDRYQTEYMRAMLETNDVSSEDLDKLEDIYGRYADSSELESYASNDISSGTKTIHSHWDLVLTNNYLRDHVTEQHMDDILDFAETVGATMEVNGRVISKLRQEYSQEDNFYAPEDAEMFGRKLASRSQNSDLEYVASTDAHSSWEMFKQHLMLEPIAREYGEPMDRTEFYSS